MTSTEQAIPTTRVPLHRLAHARTGDKGNRLSLSLFAYDHAHYDTLVAQITEDRVHELFDHRGVSRVQRYLLPQLAGMNFVIDDVLQGGVNGALNLDGHGKTLSFLLLGTQIEIERGLLTLIGPKDNRPAAAATGKGQSDPDGAYEPE